MKILFVQKKLRTDKLGILYLSAILKQNGHETYLIQTDQQNIYNTFQSFKPNFICYSIMTGQQQYILQLNKKLKDTYGNFKSIFGGPHYTFFPQQIQNNDYIDFVVTGPGQDVILNIIQGKINQKVIRGSIPNLNEIPLPDRQILYRYDQFGQAKMKRFIAKRDCPNACIYCFNHAYHNMYKDSKHKFFQSVQPFKVVQQIINTKIKWPLQMVYFNDDDFIVDNDWAKQFCKIYKQKVNLPFCGSIRANNSNEQILNILKDRNCHFMNVGLQSSVYQTQRLLQRGNITNQQVKNCVKYRQKIGIKIRVQNMIGLPVDNPLQDALKTLHFNQQLNATDSWVSIFQPYRKTKSWDISVKKGYITQQSNSNKFFYEQTQMNIPNKQQINTLHKLWSYFVKYKMPIQLIKILIQQPFDKNVMQKLQNYRWESFSKEIYKL